VYDLVMSRPLEFGVGEFYHGYNRGNDKRTIFIDEQDKERFQKLLYLCNGQKALDFRAIPQGLDAYDYDKGERLVAIGSYSLMDNHLHLLMHEIVDGGISAFMQKIGTAHTMFFNKKYDRSGSLFQGPFKAKHLDSDEYLKHIFAYIHLNQIDLIESGWKEKKIRNMRKVIEHLESYKFSSLPDHLDIRRKENKILNLSYFPKYFETVEEVWDELGDWLEDGDYKGLAFAKARPS